MTLRAYEGRMTFIAIHYNVSFKQIICKHLLSVWVICQALDILYSTHIHEVYSRTKSHVKNKPKNIQIK